MGMTDAGQGVEDAETEWGDRTERQEGNEDHSDAPAAAARLLALVRPEQQLFRAEKRCASSKGLQAAQWQVKTGG